MLDPFGDFETAGYLRNVRQDKDPSDIKHFEHNLFRANLDAALAHLASRRELTYQDFLAVHRILFSDYYPWAGEDRTVTMPNNTVRKGEVVFASPQELRLAVEFGLRIAQDPATMTKKPGEAMGFFAYGHPFLDGNGRTMFLVHMELCHRAGFSLAWGNTKKDDYLNALTQEIDTPGKGLLDAYLLQFKDKQLDRGSWGIGILAVKGLDGLDEGNQIDRDLSDPSVAEQYRKANEKHSYAYIAMQTLAQQWRAVPGRYQCTGGVVALSETEVVQDAGRGQYVVWDRRKLQDSNLEVGKKLTILESGKVVGRPAPDDLDR